MELVARYRQQAEKCRRLAKKMIFEEHEVALLQMAVWWHDVARARERYLLGQGERKACPPDPPTAPTHQPRLPA